jgi:SAM-dependent methyltransferase
MQEILKILPAGARVLDLGSNRGSFDATPFNLRIFRADLSVPSQPRDLFIACSADSLPFADHAFDAVIMNHSLEHFENLQACVSEIARVLSRNGYLYVAVPDASTLTDRVYRWLGRGGGHVNPFTDSDTVARMFVDATGLRRAGTRVLHTSLSFLNRRNIPGRGPRKLLLFCNGNESFIRILTYLLRRLDQTFNTRASVYGWAFFWGAGIAPDGDAWTNVCVRCGAGVPSARLECEGRVVHRRFLPDFYLCPGCGTRNNFTVDSTASLKS